MSASRVLVAVAARSLSELPEDVTLPQYRLLVVLASRGPQLVGAIADRLEVQPSTATRLCDRLARKGLIRRRHSSTSRREVEVSLSRDGRRLVDEVTERRRRAIAGIVSGIPPERRNLVMTALVELTNAAGEVPEQAWSLGWGP